MAIKSGIKEHKYYYSYHTYLCVVNVVDAGVHWEWLTDRVRCCRHIMYNIRTNSRDALTFSQVNLHLTWIIMFHLDLWAAVPVKCMHVCLQHICITIFHWLAHLCVVTTGIHVSFWPGRTIDPLNETTDHGFVVAVQEVFCIGKYVLTDAWSLYSLTCCTCAVHQCSCRLPFHWPMQWCNICAVRNTVDRHSPFSISILQTAHSWTNAAVFLQQVTHLPPLQDILLPMT